MSEPKFTPGPWRHATTGCFGNSVEGKTGHKYEDGDDVYRTVAAVEYCCASDEHKDQEENMQANINLIAAAPDMYKALAMVSGLDLHHEILNVVDGVLAKARGETK